MYLKQLPEYLRAIGYDKPSKFVPLLAISFLITASELLSIILIFPIIQAFLDFEAFSSSRYTKILSGFLHLDDPSQVAIVLVSLLSGMILVRGLISFYGYRYIFNVISHDEAAFAAREYERLLNRDFLFFQKSQSSKIIRDIAIAIPIGFSTVLQALLTLSTEALVFSGIAVYLLLLSPQFFIVVLAILAIAAFLYGKAIGPVLARRGRERHEVTHKTIGTISQSIEGIGQIKNWQSEKFFARLFGAQRHDQARIVASLMAIQNIPKIYFESIVMLVLCGALVYFLLTGTAITTFLPLLGFYVVAAFRSLPSVLRISAQYNVLVSSRPGFETILSLGKSSSKILNPAQGASLSLSHDLEIKNMQFAYEEEPVIRGLNLSLGQGEMIGLSGRSGEGKTTLVNLIVGLLPVQEGSILIDGMSLGNNEQAILLRTVGYVSQNTFLLDDTIRANVAFGINSDDIDDQKVAQALAFAQLDDFVSALPEGIFYVVGERGSRLSGGQRQRMGIARAFYFDRDILILDEATASLDEETESSFINVLRALKGQKTIIVISHKPGPLSICDKVYEMKNGSLLLQQQVKKAAHA